MPVSMYHLHHLKCLPELFAELLFIWGILPGLFIKLLNMRPHGLPHMPKYHLSAGDCLQQLWSGLQ